MYISSEYMYMYTIMLIRHWKSPNRTRQTPVFFFHGQIAGKIERVVPCNNMIDRVYFIFRRYCRQKIINGGTRICNFYALDYSVLNVNNDCRRRDFFYIWNSIQLDKGGLSYSIMSSYLNGHCADLIKTGAVVGY